MGDTTTDNENPGDLRNQRDQLANTNKDLAAKLAAYEQDEQLREAGLGHLSKRQRRTILREMAEEGTDFSADSAKEIAKELGYKTEADTTTPPPTNDAGQGNGNGQQGQPQNQDQDPDIEDSLTAMDLMRKAQAVAAGNAPSSDFESEIKATKSKEELTDLIRTKGARHNIVHEWDVP